MKDEEVVELEEETCCGKAKFNSHNEEEETSSECCGSDCHDNELQEGDVELTLEEMIEHYESQITELKDQLLRNQADLENFKRRLNDERIKDNKYRSQSLATAILPALDNFERALGVTVENDEVKNFLEGFKMIHGQFIESLAAEGVEVIEAKGQAFDPNYHQAVMQEEVEGTEAGLVLAEMQKGYKLKDRVIRPAMVKVSE